MSNLAIYVPVSTTVLIAAIVARGSAIIGPENLDNSEYITVDYEGAVYSQANIKTYADRARHAAGRQLAHYPTVARSVVLRSDLRQVGWFDLANGITLLDDAMEAAAAWLGVEVIDPVELHFS